MRRGGCPPDKVCRDFGLELPRQNGRLLERLDALEVAFAGGAATAARPRVRPAPASPSPTFRRLPPSFPRTSSWRSSTAPRCLAQAIDAEQPTLLVFSDPRCGPCRALVPQLAAWQREHAGQLAVELVSRGDAEENRPHAEEHVIERLLLDPDGAVADAFAVLGTPSAVLVGPDGRVVAGPAPGAAAIGALVAQHAPASAPLLRVVQAGRQ